MPSSVPRAIWSSVPIPNSCGNSANAENWAVSALLASEGHYRYPNGQWSGGGPFYVHRESITHGGKGSITTWANGTLRRDDYYGATGVTATKPVLSQALVNEGLDDAAAWGLRGYNRTKPGKPLADLFVSGKEIVSDGLPSVPFGDVIFGKGGLMSALGGGKIPWSEIPGRLKDKVRDLSGLGGEYLNGVFGWLPLVRDLQKLLGAMKNVDSAMAKLASQNGQWIRRRAILRNDVNAGIEATSSSKFPFQNTYCGPPSYVPMQNGGGSVYTRWASTRTKIWYSACYRYWIPDLPAWQFGGAARRALFGANPTPGAIYSAMPWSWLADWFTDFGEIADALSPTAVDGLTMRYGYTMYNDEFRRQASVVGYCPRVDTRNNFGTGYQWGAVDVSCYSLHFRERKIRTGGINPFGPGVQLGDITPSRWAILAALGISRGDLKL